MAFPREHWTKLRSTNPLKRPNKEIARRSDVVGILRLMGLAGVGCDGCDDATEATKSTGLTLGRGVAATASSALAQRRPRSATAPTPAGEPITRQRRGGSPDSGSGNTQPSRPAAALLESRPSARALMIQPPLHETGGTKEWA